METDQEVAAQLKRLREEKAAVESELTSLRTASSSEVKEKAELIASEKKYRSQVSLAEGLELCGFRPLLTVVYKYHD